MGEGGRGGGLEQTDMLMELLPVPVNGSEQPWSYKCVGAKDKGHDLTAHSGLLLASRMEPIVLVWLCAQTLLAFSQQL